jgi:hypothetical protein
VDKIPKDVSGKNKVQRIYDVNLSSSVVSMWFRGFQNFLLEETAIGCFG